MKRLYIVLIGLIFLFPCFLKAQNNKEILWRRGGEIGAQQISFSVDSSEIFIRSNNQFEVRSTVTGGFLRRSDTTRLYNPENYTLPLQGDSLALVLKGDSLVLIDTRSESILQYYDSLSPVVHTSDFYSLAVHHQSGRAAIAIRDSIFIFTITTGEVLKKITGLSVYNSSLSFTPDGKQIAISAGRFILVDIVSEKIIQTAPIQNTQPEWGKVLIAPSGLAFIISRPTSGDCAPRNFDRMGRYSVLKIWDMNKQERIIPDRFAHEKQTYFAGFIENFTKFRTIDIDSVALTWDIRNGDLLLKRESF